MTDQTTSTAPPPKSPRNRRILFAVLPLVLFAALVGAMGYQLLYGNDPRLIPSALLGDPVPAIEVPALKDDKPGFSNADFGGEPILVNVFASWCVPCRAEHPIITAFARDYNIPVFGLNSKDERNAALQWLAALGDPYTRIGYDPSGRAGIEWGVYGYPETFLVSPAGEVVYKYVGPISPRILQKELIPRIEAMRAQ